MRRTHRNETPKADIDKASERLKELKKEIHENSKKEPSSALDLLFDAPQSAEIRRRADLLHWIVEYVDANDLSQKDLCTILDMKQPHVSALLNGKISQFSLEKLIDVVERLGAKVELEVVGYGT